MTRTGRCTRSVSQPTVAVLPVPVAPSRTTSCSPETIRRSRSAMAVGWSPDGSKPASILKGATVRCRSVIGRMHRAYAGPPTLPPSQPRGGTPSEGALGQGVKLLVVALGLGLGLLLHPAQEGPGALLLRVE